MGVYVRVCMFRTANNTCSVQEIRLCLFCLRICFLQSKDDGKDQEWIQSSTIPYSEHNMGK